MAQRSVSEQHGSVGRRESDVERIYRLWDAALKRGDVEAAVAMYAPDAEIESPLIPHLLGGERGVCRGEREIRRFLEVLARRRAPVRQRFRTGYFTNGKKIMWEYPRATPAGEQLDFVEVMEIESGLIRRHRVYWGWLGVDALVRGGLRR